MAGSAMAATPEVKVKNVDVYGPSTDFEITVSVTSHENGSYHVEVKEVETVTEKLYLVNSKSAKVPLQENNTYNFTLALKTKEHTINEEIEVPILIYQNEVLVKSDTVKVSVGAGDIPEQDQCQSPCIGFIPLAIAGSLFMVWKGRSRPEEK
jgi:hypothetical protein